MKKLIFPLALVMALAVMPALTAYAAIPDDPYTGRVRLLDEDGAMMVEGVVAEWWGDLADEYVLMAIEQDDGVTDNWAVRPCDVEQCD